MRSSTLALVCFVVLSVSVSFASKLSNTPITLNNANVKVSYKERSDDKTCNDCVEIMVDVINVGLNDILHGGLADCGDLCHKVFNKSLPLEYGCIGICDLVGLKEFIHMINVSDPDPIYMCQGRIDMCAAVANGSVNITSLYVSPTVAVEGTDFQIFFNYEVTSPTSAGLISVYIYPPQNAQAQGVDVVTNGQPAGVYSYEITYPSYKHGSIIGQYGAVAGVCASDCGHTHPFSGVYAVGEAFFNVTKAPKSDVDNVKVTTTKHPTTHTSTHASAAHATAAHAANSNSGNSGNSGTTYGAGIPMREGGAGKAPDATKFDF